MTDLLFDAPWWLIAGLAALGVVVFVSANKRTNIKMRTVGLGIILLAGAVLGVSYVVQTPIERAEDGSRQIVESFIAKDWTTFQNLLDPRATVTVVSAGTIYSDRTDIVAGAQTARDQYGIDRAMVTGMSVNRAGPLITTEIDVLSEQSAFGYPLRTRWQLDWVDRGQGWVIGRVNCVQIGDATGNQAAQQFPGR